MGAWEGHGGQMPFNISSSKERGFFGRRVKERKLRNGVTVRESGECIDSFKQIFPLFLT
jgi:hypothetical protein